MIKYAGLHIKYNLFTILLIFFILFIISLTLDKLFIYKLTLILQYLI